MSPRRRTEAQTTLEAERGIRDLEENLLWAAEMADAPEAAQEFASRFGWTTAAQRKELARAYAAQRLEHSRLMIDRVAERAHLMQTQYERRWQQAKSRLVLGLLLALAAVIFAAELLYALT
jgi:hypothetical protein